MYEVLLIELNVFLPLLLYAILQYFPNSQAKQGGRFMTLVRLLGMIDFLGNLMKVLKAKYFIL